MTDPSRAPIVGEWRGEPTYGCPFCPFETMNEGNFADHLRAVHHQPEGADPVEESAEPAHPIAEAPVEEPAPAPEVVDPEPPPVEPAPVASTPEPQPVESDPIMQEGP